MPRAATTTDAWNAIAEPKRRRVLSSLARGERTVGQMVDDLRWPQPQVSKHLSVLRQVGLVTVRRHGRERFYTVNAAPLKAVHEWTAMFERFWTHQLDRIKHTAEAMARAEAQLKKPQDPSSPSKETLP